jgi:hypothetical protein
MTSQPRQEPFNQGPISTEQHSTSSPFASPPHEDPCLPTGEGLQEESRRLQQCVRELLVENQQLRILLESANKSPGQEASLLNASGTSEETNHTRGHYESTDASGK